MGSRPSPTATRRAASCSISPVARYRPPTRRCRRDSSANWDQPLLAYADRDRIIPPEIQPLQLTLSGDPTVTVDGRVAASWQVEDGRIVITPHADLPRAAVREEALRDARFLEARPEVSFSA